MIITQGLLAGLADAAGMVLVPVPGGWALYDDEGLVTAVPDGAGVVRALERYLERHKGASNRDMAHRCAVADGVLEDAAIEAEQDRCDHEFHDTEHCIRCGWADREGGF